MKPNPTVLVVDADRPIRRLLRVVLEPHHYKVYEAENGQTGMKEAVARQPDVIILELALPDINGLSLLKRLREWNPVPVLILSAQNDEESKVAALDGGANDYMTKPFGSSELRARLRVLQRSMPSESDGPLYINGDLQVDMTSHLVTMSGRQVFLSRTEEAVFCTLVRHAGKLVTCTHLMRCVWGTDSENKLHDLHVYIRCLRQKLRGTAGDVLIQTEGSAGYRLLVPMACQGPTQEPSPPKLIVASA